MTDPTTFVAELRNLIATTRTADLTTVADLAPLADRLREVRAALEPHVVHDVPNQSSLGSAALDVEVGQLPGLGGETSEEFFPYSPMIGPLNPISPPVRLWVDGTTVRGEGTLGPAYAGPPGAVHGGLVATIMDEVLGLACVINEVAGFTGTLSVRYESLVPVGGHLTMRGWVETVDGRKTIARGELHHGDTRCVTAEGIFISPRE